MSADFELRKSEINQLRNTYEKSANEIENALKEYNNKIEALLGSNWKGSASEKFANTILEYNNSIRKIIIGLNQYQSVIDHVGTKLGYLSAEGEKVGDQMQAANL